jgi:hypothetical protein
MKPMFLPDVEQNPQPGPYRTLIEQMQAQGAEYPQIWHLSRTCPAPPITWPVSHRRSCVGRRRSARDCAR